GRPHPGGCLSRYDRRSGDPELGQRRRRRYRAADQQRRAPPGCRSTAAESGAGLRRGVGGPPQMGGTPGQGGRRCLPVAPGRPSGNGRAMTDLQATGPVRAITFDLDFTLWDLEGVIHRAEMLQYQFLCQHYPEVGRRYSAEAFQALRFRLHEQRPDLRYNATLLRQEALRTVAIECGYDESLVKQAFQVFLDARHDVKLYDDTVPLLERLHGRYVLGVITNGNADVRRLGLGGYFDFTLSPMEVGAAKP